MPRTRKTLIRVLNCSTPDIASRLATELAAKGYDSIRQGDSEAVAVRVPVDTLTESLTELEHIRKETEAWARA